MLLSKTNLWCETSGQQLRLGGVEEGERVKCRGFWGLEMLSFMVRALVTWGCSLCDHSLMICILLCMCDKPHKKVYQKKVLLSWQQKKTFFFFFFSDSSHAVEVIKKLEFSHIARGSVHEHSLLWGTIQPYGFELLEIFLFVNSVVLLLRLYLKKQS